MPTGGGTGGASGGIFHEAGGHEARKGTELHRLLMKGGMHDYAHNHPTLDMNHAIAAILKANK